MAGTIDTTGKVSNQIMSSTSKTSNTKKSNTLNMENFLSLLVAEMHERVLSQTASNLIGKAVIVKTDTNSTGYAGGIVNGWQEIDGIVYLGINGNLYDINDVDQVIDKDYYEKWNNSGSTTGSSKTDTDNKTK